MRKYRLGREFTPKLTMSLHTGWAIEGGIGSEQRLDATYLSPQIDIGSRYAYLCDEYQLQLIISDNVYNLFTSKVKGFLRKIDVITMNELKDPVGLFTFDLSDDPLEAPEGHNIAEIILLEEFTSANIDAYKSKSADYMFTTDADIANLHKGADEIANPYREGLAAFLSGDWESAAEWFEQCLGIWPSDGPTKALLNVTQSCNYTAPEDWRGYRNIDEQIQIAETMEAQEEEGKQQTGEAEEAKEEKKDGKEAKGKPAKKQLVAIEENEEEESVVPALKKQTEEEQETALLKKDSDEMEKKTDESPPPAKIDLLELPREEVPSKKEESPKQKQEELGSPEFLQDSPK